MFPFRFLAFASLGAITWLSAMPVASAADDTPPTNVTSRIFGHTPQGEVVTLYTLTNKSGMSVAVMDYGATIVKLIVPDRTGHFDDVVLGFDTFTPYLHTTTYFGATIGRYANRIAQGRFAFGRTVYELPRNNNGQSLHGGMRGFDKRMWKAEPVESEMPSIRFSRLSADGEEGYPGNLFVSVTFTLEDDNALRISYEATTDKPTIINLTNHSYFNLSTSGSIKGDLLQVNADTFLPTDAALIPTGEFKAVAGTPWDFRKPVPIGLHLMETGGKPIGYDHNFVLNKGWFSDSSVAAVLQDPKSGRTLTVSTDQPGLQVYTGGYLDDVVVTGKGGVVYHKYDAITLETQHFPDSPNHADFPSTVLAPGQTYQTSTVFKFGTIPPSP